MAQLDRHRQSKALYTAGNLVSIPQPFHAIHDTLRFVALHRSSFHTWAALLNSFHSPWMEVKAALDAHGEFAEALEAEQRLIVSRLTEQLQREGAARQERRVRRTLGV